MTGREIEERGGVLGLPAEAGMADPGGGGLLAPPMPIHEPRRHEPPPEQEKRKRDFESHSLVSLLELSHEINLADDVFQIAEMALFNIMGHLGTPLAALWLLPATEAGDAAEAGIATEAVLLASQGVRRAQIEAVGVSCAPELVRRFHTRPQVLDLEREEDVAGARSLVLARRQGIARFAPLLVRSELRGWLALGPRIGGRPYGGIESEVLRASLDILSVALDNSALTTRLRENNRRLRRVNEDLKELDRLKSEFMANMNHELRTPLTAIQAYLQILQDLEMDEENRRENSRLALDECVRLKGMITRLLNFQATADEEAQLPREPAELLAPLRRYFEERRPGIVGDLREFAIMLEDEVPFARFHERRLLEIVDALVENAIKFTPRGSRIVLRLGQHAHGDVRWAKVAVEDDGPGIPPERLPSLFEAFRTGDGSSTREVGGMGVGLALAKRYADLMGARLEAESELGRGSTFTLLLPTD
ncbi:MAG: hypothetical protein JW819_01700 [Candidatus Krumholzibacteriota bacterium]|nr:hypothetical protein [Candidatus Krumholzibacteriota bacterium]